MARVSAVEMSGCADECFSDGWVSRRVWWFGLNGVVIGAHREVWERISLGSDPHFDLRSGEFNSELGEM